jgi:hypothetical protein
MGVFEHDAFVVAGLVDIPGVIVMAELDPTTLMSTAPGRIDGPYPYMTTTTAMTKKGTAPRRSRP